MDAIVTQLLSCLWSGKQREISAVAAYEDGSTDARLNEFCQTFTRQLGKQCKLIKKTWQVSELRMPELRAIAAADAATADVIIIAVHHQESLPAELSSWIDLWLPQRGKRPRVLLALFDALHQGNSGSIRMHLQEAAKRGKMEFLVQTDESAVASDTAGD